MDLAEVAVSAARQPPRDCYEGIKRGRARLTGVSTFAVAARAININCYQSDSGDGCYLRKTSECCDGRGWAELTTRSPVTA